MGLTPVEQQNVKLVQDGMSAILETKNAEVVNAAFAEDFIQHNPWAKDGIAHVREMLGFDFGYKAVRWVAEDDIVAYLGYYTAPNPLGDHPLYCTDVWRVENGKIAEHWDALVPMPQEDLDRALAGGGDGLGAASPEKRAANKRTVRRYLDLALNRGALERMPEFVADAYVYHHEKEGALPGREQLAGFFKSLPGGRKPHDLKLLLASGDLVMAQTHCFGEPDAVVYDWFRLDADAKIAEQWAVTQPMLPLADAANEHPHF